MSKKENTQDNNAYRQVQQSGELSQLSPFFLIDEENDEQLGNSRRNHLTANFNDVNSPK